MVKPPPDTVERRDVYRRERKTKRRAEPDRRQVVQVRADDRGEVTT